MYNPTFIIRSYDTLNKKILLNIAILSCLFKNILYFLKDESIPTQTIMRIIKKVEPYILSPITLRTCIHEPRKYNSMSIIDDGNFMKDLLILGIDLTEEAINKTEDNMLIDK